MSIAKNPANARATRGAARRVATAVGAKSARTAQRSAGPAAPLSRRNLPLLLLQAREGVMAHFRPVLNAAGVTEQQWRIVRALLELGPLEPRQIGAVCRLSSPSLAGVLARMGDIGLVRRERLAHDQRRVMVSLTPSSRALAAAMAPRIEAVYAAIEAHIGGEFIARLYATLDELIGLLGEVPAPAPEQHQTLEGRG